MNTQPQTPLNRQPIAQGSRETLARDGVPVAPVDAATLQTAATLGPFTPADVTPVDIRPADSAGVISGDAKVTHSTPLVHIDPAAWYMRRLYLPLGKWLSRYHRVHRAQLTPPSGPCIYVTHHGFGYLSMDIFVAAYLIGYRHCFEEGGAHLNLRTTISFSKLEKHLPVLGTVFEQVGGIRPDYDAMVSALAGGHQVLMTPGGSREAQPCRNGNPYQLRWANRLGFIRTALRAGVPIVPLAIVGGHRAFPGLAWGKVSLWWPVPMPSRLQIALGEPIPVPHAPDRINDVPFVEALQQQAWRATEALYDRLLGRAGQRKDQ